MRRRQEAWKKRKREEPSATVRLDDAIELPVGADIAWTYLRDARSVASFLPGLVPGSIEQVSDSRFTGTLKHVALGVPSTWLLTADVKRVDAEHRLDIHLDGEELRLVLHLAGDARLVVQDADPPRLDYRGELTVRGRLAGAGGPIIERVIGTIIERFVEAVAAAGDVRARRTWWQRVRVRLRILFT
jgi:carbon monoxide dehydrogenase subunit G